MTRKAPHPGFLPGEKVTLQHETLGTLRLIVTHTEPSLWSGAPWGGAPWGGPWVVCTTADNNGHYRRKANDLTRGWGN